MQKLSARQVHLDFHTSENIGNVGAAFDKRDFQKALQLGNVNSVTVFAKCHHSWSYYPTRVGKRHPNLKIDLLGQQIEACHEIGIRAPIYYTVGWSAHDAEQHPEWTVRRRDGAIAAHNFDLSARPDDPKPATSWIFLCPGTGYRDLILRQTEEICRKFPVDGFFYDICDVSPPCWCEACVKGMKADGLNPDNENDARTHAIQTWVRLMSDCNAIIHGHHRSATIFYNGTTKLHSPHEFAAFNTHFELEDLPTTWGGYDKLPLRGKLFSAMGKPTLAMSGKFHTQWGEFGGFKHPDAMRFEAACMVAYGAGCSFGDQLHPSGKMDLQTYLGIGKAYKHVKRIESYGIGAKPFSNLGVYVSGRHAHDEGVARMLLEQQIDFEAVRHETDLDHFDAIILTGDAFLDDIEAARLREFVNKGGSLLILGYSAFDRSKKKLLFDLGGKYLGAARFDCDYTKTDLINVASPVLNYTPAPRIEVTNGRSLAAIFEPYFSRTYGRYCSHMNTPNQLAPAGHSGVIQKERIVYCASPLGQMYCDHGARLHRDLFIVALRRIYRKQILETQLPSAGRASLLHQPEKRRYVVHLLYSPPLQRGRCLVIEDFPPLFDVQVMLHVPQTIRKASMPLSRKGLKIVRKNKSVSVVVPEMHNGHEIVRFDY